VWLSTTGQCLTQCFTEPPCVHGVREVSFDFVSCCSDDFGCLSLDIFLCDFLLRGGKYTYTYIHIDIFIFIFGIRTNGFGCL